ncbi:MAG TPA: RNA-binding S4 domain-containing protein [Burkholderiales bacterium]|nr:RNA-binding S4 domain-containing protein [Burkholderiales bacterium]
MKGPLQAVRIDKWLWAARFYKTRSLAQQAVQGGKVELNGERVKPAREVKPGDALAIRIGEYEWLLSVTALAERRGSAELARGLYRESEESRARRQEMAEARRLVPEPSLAIKGRPTKRERRALERLRRGE